MALFASLEKFRATILTKHFNQGRKEERKKLTITITQLLSATMQFTVHMLPFCIISVRARATGLCHYVHALV